MWHLIIKLNPWKRKLANKGENTAKKWKVITLEEKLKSNVSSMTEKKNQWLWEWDADTTVQQKNFPFTTSHLSDISWHWKHKGSCQKTDPNLERRVAIQQGLGKMLTKYHKVSDQEKASTAQITDKFFTKK